MEVPPSGSSAFDYSGLNDQTVAVLHLAESEIREARQVYICRVSAAVASAHDELVANCEGHNQHSDDTFIAWCRFVGIRKDTAYRLLQVNNLLTGATAEEQATLEAASPSLLYAAAKPSAPAELVQAVKEGDITTHKQYQEALARIRTLENQNASLLHSYETERGKAEAADRRAEEEQRKRKEADEGCASAMETLRQAQEDAADSDARARAAENRAVGAQKLADQRGAENTELKAKLRELESRPVEVAVAQPGEDQIEAWRKEGEERMAATMQETVRKAHQETQKAKNQVTDLQEQLATARPDADACQRTADTLYETTENLRLLLRTQLKLAQLPPDTYGKVVAHVLQAADALRDTVRSCAPAGYTMDDEEEDFL